MGGAMAPPKYITGKQLCQEASSEFCAYAWLFLLHDSFSPACKPDIFCRNESNEPPHVVYSFRRVGCVSTNVVHQHFPHYTEACEVSSAYDRQFSFVVVAKDD